MIWALLAVSVAGLANGIHGSYLMWQLGRGCATGCPLVMGTKYARLLGFPNTYIAIAFFFALIAFAGARLAGVAVPIWPALAAAGTSVLTSANLAWALLIKLRQT